MNALTWAALALLVPATASSSQESADPPVEQVANTVEAVRAQDPVELEIEILETLLRPMTLEEAEAELSEWLARLQTKCIELRDFELSSLGEEDPAQLELLAEAGVELHAERGRLMDRTRVVIDVVEEKGGDVAQAAAYVDSVYDTPPITGWRAGVTVVEAWIRSPEGGVALLKRLGLAAGVLTAAWFLARILSGVTRRALGTGRSRSALLNEFLVSGVGRLTILLGVVVAIGQMGISINPFLAALGAAGLVVGLALQGTLGNIANGIMIMVYRPFDVGDLIISAGQLGHVSGMTLMTTSIKTIDNQVIHIPNNMVWGDVITNVTASPRRRIDMVFGIGYGDDVPRAKAVLEEIVQGHEKILGEPGPVVRVHELGDSSVNFVVRPWVMTDDYWDVYWDVTEAVKQRFDAEGISIPFPQRDVHLIPVAPVEKSDASESPRPSVIVPERAGQACGSNGGRRLRRIVSWVRSSCA